MTYLTLKNNQGYILIPESDLSLNINCPSESKDIVLKEATLIRNDEDCILNSESVIIKLSKTVKRAKHTSFRKNITIHFSPDELDLLKDHLIPLQKHIDSEALADSSRTLDEIEIFLNKIKSERRARSWTDKASDTLSYLGYTALVTNLLFLFYKCGILTLISKCMPNLCIRICCTKNEITNNITPHVVTYIPTASPQGNETNVESVEPLVEHRLVKLRQKKSMFFQE